MLQKTLVNVVSSDLLPFIIGQSYDSFALLSISDVSDVISALPADHYLKCCGQGTDRRAL
jgi:hypothetical protein